ncbi:helix-turn-helix domain-containing protein [Buttiauxella noackiae]|uniref:helix-turn-helix domain-containing protein n=1 Tax=Buttiauxella noackiae TaxID=82992 RepID=UPI0005541705|nr:helix-turn-helix domain-containing protein [Buttiauxella noackiae]
MKSSDIHDSILIIGKAIELSKESYEENHKRNQRIELLNNNTICYLKKGRVLVYRNDNNLVTLSLNAPLIMGLTQMHNDIKYHYLRCETNCQMYMIKNHSATELFNHKNLWKHAFDILTWHLDLYFHRDLMMIHPNIRNIINEHLKHIWSMPPEVRSQTSVYSFIISRNHISRSAVHKVIQEMTDVGKVRIEKGKLVFYKEVGP